MSVVLESTWLKQTELRLRGHFKDLHKRKVKLVTPPPTFALEHPLTRSETERLARELAERRRIDGRLTEELRVSWIVHAAEHGYRFSGLEYWDSFEAQLKWWNPAHDRPLLRDWFSKFATTYGGVRPQGRWAQHFTLISWPITHAILPQDLQLQLAQSLFYAARDLRYASGMTDSELGQIIRRHTFNPSARYERFLTGEAIVGQVVHALLRDGKREESPVLYAPTVDRIVGDLTLKARAREWLQAARETYGRSRVIMDGRPSAQALQRPPSSENTTTITPRAERPPSPRFELRPVASGVQLWFSPASMVETCTRHPELREIFRTRSISLDEVPAVKPASVLLSNSPPAWHLRAWPVSQTALKFAPPLPAHLIDFVSSDLSLRPDIELFECLSDGRAIRRINLIVRPGLSYVLATTKGNTALNIGTQINCDCKEVTLARVAIPKTPSSELVSALAALGIGIRRSLTVSPAGLSPRGWCGDLAPEWLACETVAFSVSHDFPCTAILVSVNHQARQHIEPSSTGITMLSLGRLDEGNYCIEFDVEVSPEQRRGSNFSPLAIDFIVRPQSTWVPYCVANEGFSVTVIPPDPSIDDLLTGRIKVEINGAGGPINCSLILVGGDGNQRINETLFSSSLPFNDGLWNSSLERFLQRPDDESELVATREGYLQFQSRDFGDHRVALRADYRPLRWAVDRRKSKNAVRLLDDGSLVDYARIHFLSFGLPLHITKVSPAQAMKGLLMDDWPGLLVAQADDFVQGVVVGGTRITGGLSALAERPQAASIDIPAKSLSWAELLRWWTSSRSAHYPASIRQRVAARFILRLWLTDLCGKRWVKLDLDAMPKRSAQAWLELEDAVSPRYQNSLVVHFCHAWRSGQVTWDSAWSFYLDGVQSFHRGRASVAAIKACWKVAVAPYSLLDHECHDLDIMDVEFRAMLVRSARLLLAYHEGIEVGH